MTKAELAIKALKATSAKKLCELWNETEKQPITLELAKVRGWIMEALESKNSAAFDLWIENDGDPAVYFAK